LQARWPVRYSAARMGAAVGLSAASAYVATRVLESTVIGVGLISLLAVVRLREDLVGAANSDPATLDAVGSALVAIKDGTFLLGPAFLRGARERPAARLP